MVAQAGGRLPSAPPQAPAPAVDWVASFPGTGGLEIPTDTTGTADPVLLDIRGFLIGGGAENVHIELGEFVYIDGGERKEGFRNEVREFREVKPGFFFPWSGRFTHSESVSDWTMLEVRVNEPLDAALFRVEPGPQTRIENPIAGPPTDQHDTAPSPPLIQRLRWPLLTGLFVIAVAFGARKLLARERA